MYLAIFVKAAWKSFRVKINDDLRESVVYEHIHKGPPGKRELTEMCLVQFASNAARDNVFGKLQTQKVHDKHTKELKFDGAKILL